MTDRIIRIARSASWRAAFIQAQGYRCHYCNRPGGPQVGPDARPWHIDHKDALAEGGEDAEENLVLACKRCNIAKGTQPYDRFRAFARVAFWSEAPEPTSEDELGDLLDAWAGTQQGIWSYQLPDREGARNTYRVWSRPNGEITDSSDDLVADIHRCTSGRSCVGHSVAEFLVRAHRIVPALIAEIRVLRAELAEAHGEAQDGSPESAA